ncbi:YciI family protein [Actinomadura fulvescens]|uniref:YCII-related domain-containing protein n=1 Tax=Actinomadura fulvescens TaxID=46160 RepID=A0ABN3Q0X3_9ACTN
MKYALVIIETDESRRAIGRDRAGHRQAIADWMVEQGQAGILVDGQAFETESVPPVTVRKTANREVSVVHEPFAGEHETLGGYAVIEAATMEEAVKAASSWPTPETIEIRPIWTQG